jgi:anaerobic ribonucleoside-triphosphate reductase activating protein
MIRLLVGVLVFVINTAYRDRPVHSPNSPVSSSNQRLHIFNPQLQDQITWASDKIEVHVLNNGDRLVTGYRRYEE